MKFELFNDHLIQNNIIVLLVLESSLTLLIFFVCFAYHISPGYTYHTVKCYACFNVVFLS